MSKPDYKNQPFAAAVINPSGTTKFAESGQDLVVVCVTEIAASEQSVRMPR